MSSMTVPLFTHTKCETAAIESLRDDRFAITGRVVVHGHHVDATCCDFCRGSFEPYADLAITNVQMYTVNKGPNVDKLVIL